MIKIDAFEIWGFEAAIRGMRNSFNSWDKSDSNFSRVIPDIGEADLKLMENLSAGGSSHAKFRRFIKVSLDIAAPLYWWKEFDTYKVGTVTNSCSTMHTIADKEFELDDFSHEHLRETTSDSTNTIKVLKKLIECLNYYRSQFVFTKDKKYWWQMIQLLPSSYNQKRTVLLNYEVLHSIYKDRRNHKLDEWQQFCDWIETLPYTKGIVVPKVVEKNTWDFAKK